MSREVLRNLLASPLEREADVVYLLVEVRKVIEGLQGERYPVLKFFCDWVLHSRLNRKTAKDILSVFDAYACEFLATGGRKLPASHETIKDLISFTPFADDLMLLLAECNLDTRLVGDVSRWLQFFGLYIDIITRIPLVGDMKALKLRQMDSIRLLKENGPMRPAPAGDNFVFSFSWSLRYRGKEIVSVTNEVLIPVKPTYSSMTVHHFEQGPHGLRRRPLESKTLWK